MKNFRFILSIIFSMVLISSGLRSWASDDHKHDEEAEKAPHAHHDEKNKDPHKGHNHGAKKSKPAPQKEKDEHGHDHGEEGHEDEHEDGPIELSEESQELGGIKTAIVGSSSFASKVSVSGRIAQDVEEVKYVFASESGTIKECRANLGGQVKEGETVCVATVNSNNQSIEIKAPISGTVISEFIKKGEHVDETTAIYAIADLSKLWANFDVYEKDIGFVKLGQKMLVYPLSYPDKTLEGEVVFISPRVDESTYTVKIRAVVDNTNDLLKLGMSVRGDILGEADGSVLTIPSEAIQTVENKTVVFKKMEKGFEPQEVKVLSQTKESAAIQEGVSKGDEIVVKGSFILKSKMMASEMGHDHAH